MAIHKESCDAVRSLPCWVKQHDLILSDFVADQTSTGARQMSRSWQGGNDRQSTQTGRDACTKDGMSEEKERGSA